MKEQLRVKTKFNNLKSVEQYLLDNKYKKKDSFIVKNDRSYIYKHRNKNRFIHVSSKVDYINVDTMDRGVVWTLTAF